MSKYKEFSDTELVGLLKPDHHVITIAAYKVIFDRYYPSLVLHVNRMLGDINLAKDIVQEIFTRLFQQRGNTNFNNSLFDYLCAAVRVKVVVNLQHAKVKMDYTADFFKFSESDEELDDEKACLIDLASTIRFEIEKMPAEMREKYEITNKLSQEQLFRLLNLAQ